MAELVVRSAGIRKFWVRIPFAIFIKKIHLEFLSKQLFSNILTSVQTLKTSNLFNVDVSHLITCPKMARTITITLYGSPCYMAEQNTMQNDINTPGKRD